MKPTLMDFIGAFKAGDKKEMIKSPLYDCIRTTRSHTDRNSVWHKILRMPPYFISPQAKYVHIIRSATFRTNVEDGSFEIFSAEIWCNGSHRFITDPPDGKNYARRNRRHLNRFTSRLTREQFKSICPCCASQVRRYAASTATGRSIIDATKYPLSSFIR